MHTKTQGGRDLPAELSAVVPVSRRSSPRGGNGSAPKPSAVVPEWRRKTPIEFLGSGLDPLAKAIEKAMGAKERPWRDERNRIVNDEPIVIDILGAAMRFVGIDSSIRKDPFRWVKDKKDLRRKQRFPKTKNGKPEIDPRQAAAEDVAKPIGLSEMPQW